MAKRKARTGNRAKNRGRRVKDEIRSSGGPLRWFGRLLLLTIILVALFWQRGGITSWFDETTESTVGLLGWGIALIVLAVIITVAVLWRRQLSDLARRWKLYQWNRWLGAAAFVLAAWGILALIDLGGSFGQTLIGGQQGIIGVLRILGLTTLAVILVAPRASYRAVAGFFSWIVKPPKVPLPPPRPAGEGFKSRFGKPAGPGLGVVEEPPRAQKMTPPPLLVPPEIPRAELKTRQVTPSVTAKATPSVTPGQPPKDLRQVAQEVWKKYGESPSLVTVDGWRLPPIDILDRSAEVEFGQVDNIKRAELIEEALASYGVDAKVVQINAGPTVTQFGVEPGWDRKLRQVREKDKDGNISVSQKEVSRTRVKVERITSLANDLALALASPSIRIEAPVPGKSVVGIEVPNTSYGVVSLRGVIETNPFQKIMARSGLALALGKGAGGEAVAGDLARMPHLLIAGATGSGKTVCLNSIICCLLLNNTPNDIKFIMIDPKRVELTLFNSLPHLTVPVIVDAQKALAALRWLNEEMEKRYQELATATARNIEAYNKNKKGDEKLPYVVLIIDELADLMMTGVDEVERILCRLAQLARAVGIHLVVATQRPSVDVVTGLIKANFPTRISFAVTSQVDSRTILDGGGAEKLLGRGDMLYMPTEAAKPKRLQGCFVSDTEAERLVYFWNTQRQEEAAALKVDELIPSATAGIKEGYPSDPLLEAAKKLAVEHESISTSYLQRRLHIGYPRAARLMEQLEEELEKGEGV